VGAGGWGAALGDEGSGYWIGFKAMRAMLQAHDGRLEETRLTKAVLEHFGLSQPKDLPFRVHVAVEVTEALSGERTRFVIDSGTVIERLGQRPSPNGAQESEASDGGLFYRKVTPTRPLRRHEIASLCSAVVKVARQGDWKALEILEEAGHESGRLGAAVIKRLGMEQEEFAVVPFGGVFKAGELVLRTFRETIHATAPWATIVEPEFEPEVGAVLLALNDIGVTIDDHIIETIEQSSVNFPACRRY